MLIKKQLVTLSGKLMTAQESAERIAESYRHISAGFEAGELTLPIARRVVLALEVRSAELVQLIVAAGHSYADLCELMCCHDDNSSAA